MTNSPEHDADMQIFADSFRVMSDSSACDSLVLAWDKKIELPGFGQNLLSQEEALKQHYSVVSKVLEKIGLPSAEDPIDRTVASIKEPAMVVSATLRVMAVNPSGRKAFGIEQGQIAQLNWLCHSDRATFRDLVGALARSPVQHCRIFRTQGAGSRSGFAKVYLIEVPGIDDRFAAVRELAMR